MAAPLQTWLLRGSAAAQLQEPRRGGGGRGRAHPELLIHPLPQSPTPGLCSQTFPLHSSGHVLPVLGAAQKSGHLL